MKPLILLLFFYIPFYSSAQQYERFYAYQWHPCDAANARFYTELNKKDSLWERKDYFIHERSLQMTGSYTDTSCKIAEGLFYYYHPNKSLESFGSFKHGKKDGVWISYYPNGMIHDSITYISGNKTGISYSWHSNGYLRDSAVWNNDGSGVEVSWFDNG